jgi:anti-sigma regulatory factor (Ser/Thr protein kinase)
MTQPSHQLLRVRDHSDVGAARRAVDVLAGSLGVAEQTSESARIAATELGTNILRHGEDGYLLLRSLDRRRGLEMLAVDRGRGIADPASALAGAGATSGGLGIGLGSVRRLASSFDLYTGVSKGTVVLGRFDADRAPDDAAPGGPFRAGGVSLPVVSGDLNGDGWAVARDDRSCSALVVDGLGHGPPAHQAAQAGLRAFDTDYAGDVACWFQAAHAAMRHTRGGVAALARIDLAERRVWFAGVGNVQGKVVAGGQTFGLVSQPGMLGTEQRTPRPRVVELPWVPGASLILWSDGLRSNVELHHGGKLLTHDPTIVAGVLHRDFARGTDDATVVVVQDRTGGWS